MILKGLKVLSKSINTLLQHPVEINDIFPGFTSDLQISVDRLFNLNERLPSLSQSSYRNFLSDIKAEKLLIDGSYAMHAFQKFTTSSKLWSYKPSRTQSEDLEIKIKKMQALYLQKTFDSEKIQKGIIFYSFYAYLQSILQVN